MQKNNCLHRKSALQKYTRTNDNSASHITDSLDLKHINKNKKWRLETIHKNRAKPKSLTSRRLFKLK